MKPAFAMLLALPLLLGATAADPVAHPGIDIERLRKLAPGWLMLEADGDEVSGMAVAEQSIWPMFYLHWMPLEGHGRTIGVKEAGKIVTSLWDGLVIDGPLKGETVKLPSHEAVMFDATTTHGELKTRYFVWACPESGRLFVADLNVNLRANAPPELMQWQTDMTRTVRCHEDAPVETFPELTDRYEIPDVGIAYSHPPTWRPLEAYRVQTAFGGSDMAASRWPGSTREKGQDLTLAVDAMRRMTLMWGPAPEGPMSHDVLRKRTQDYWSERASNIMITDTKSINGLWYADGVVRMPINPGDIPPTHMHKFRTWMWQKGDTLFFAVGDLAGIHFGRRKLALPLEVWNASLEDMFEGLIH